MLINRIIINSSPLIVLFKSQQAKLLPQLFKHRKTQKNNCLLNFL